MGEDEHRSPSGPPRRHSSAPAPWERPWAVAPSPPSATDPTADPVDETPRRGLHDEQVHQVSVGDLLRRIGQRAGGRRRHAEPEVASVPAEVVPAPPEPDPQPRPDPEPPPPITPAAIPSVVVPTLTIPAPVVLRALSPTPATPTPATPTPATPATRPRPPLDDDTLVLPALVDDGNAPLGGTPPPPVVRTPPRRPPVVPPPRPTPPRPTPPRPTPQRAVPSPVPADAAAADAADHVPTRLQAKKSRRQRRAALAGKAAVALVAILVFAVTGTAWSALRYVDAKQQTVQALDQGSAAVVEPEKQLGDENFLLIGSDSRAGASGQIGAGTESQVSGARSDTTMLVHVPADRSRVVIVSFPRDLQVDLPACTRWDNDTSSYTAEVVPPQQGVKLNTAYFEGGPQCITKVVQQLSGLNVNHFLGVDFAGFQSMVDAVGGVQVCTEKPLQDTVLGTVLATTGTQTIDGQQALNYVRARHVIGDPTSDYGRIQRQQRFLSSLLRASLSRDTLLDLGKLKSLVDAVTASTFGENVGVQQLLELARSMPDLDAGRVTFITAPTTGEANSAGNEVLLDAANAELFQAIRAGQPLPGEAAADSSTTTPTTTQAPPALTATPPAAVSFVVRNATTTKGLAAKVSGELSAWGFRATGTDNYTSTSATTVVRYSAGAEAAAQTLASAVPGATLQATTGLGSAVELVLGSDAVSTSPTAPTAAGSALPVLAGGLAAPSTTALPGNLTVVNGGDASCT